MDPTKRDLYDKELYKHMHPVDYRVVAVAGVFVLVAGLWLFKARKEEGVETADGESEGVVEGDEGVVEGNTHADDENEGVEEGKTEAAHGDVNDKDEGVGDGRAGSKVQRPMCLRYVSLSNVNEHFKQLHRE